MSNLRELCCPKPDELVKRYCQGSSVKSLVNDAYRSKMFVKKENARAYVERVIYAYVIEQQELNM